MAIENGVQNVELGYILDPAFQIENLNGKPVVGGYICIYEAGTDNKYISYENFDGAQNPFKIPLRADGRAVILGDPSLTYDVYFYDSYGNQLFSRLNVQCNVPGTINLSGADTRIKNTDGTLDISLQTLGNNVRQYTINTHNKVLDVQSPLYFVENSETATIIGFNGDGFAKEDKFEYDENYNITGYDGSAFARTTYSAGDYVDITDDTISVTGLQPSGNYASASDVTALEEKLDDKLNISAFNESAVVVDKFQYEGDKITAYNNSAFVGADYEAGQYVDITDDRISVTGVQPAGNYASASDVTELNDKLANKLDASAAFTKASADTLYQPIGEYAPTGDYAYKSDLNDYQPASSMTAYATTALVSSVSSTITGMIPTGNYELVAGSGIELVDDPDTHTTTINVTAEGGNKEVENLVTANSAAWNTVSDKLDTTAFSTVSGDFLTAHQDISNLMPKSESANFYPMTGNPSGFLTAHQDLSDYATTASVADKLDTTAFSTVSGNFLTAVDLTPYQTTADMTAYQPVGDYASATDLENYQPISSMTAYQEAGDYYSASNPSGFLTDVPAGTLNESAFEYDVSNNITAYNGSAFKAGDEFPQSATNAIEYVTATSADINSTIDNVSANSGIWGGSALPVSAGPGVKIELTNNTLVFSNDETVLWEGTHDSFNTAINLSEAVSNFKRIRILFGNAENKYLLWQDIELMSASDGYYFDVVKGAGTSNFWIQGLYCSGNDTHIVPVSGKRMNFGSFTASTNITSIPVNTTYPDALMFRKIVGINRIAGGN